jgi:hypothetical protein
LSVITLLSGQGKYVLTSAEQEQMIRQSPFISLVLLMLIGVSGVARAAGATVQQDQISVSVNRKRFARGERVEITLQISRHAASSRVPVKAVFLMPSRGLETLPLQAAGNRPGIYRAEVRLGDDAPIGLYVIHAWIGASEKPTRVGKATFLVEKMVVDFLITSTLDRFRPEEDLTNYLHDFQPLGGNLLIIHNLITADGALYPSKVCRTDVTAGSPKDLVETILRQTDRRGIAAFLSVSWDMTRQSPYQDRLREIKAIIDELYALYRHHPSLAGFYSYQEGSGTYYVDYVREFSRHVKGLKANLLTACAPHLDDPLLAGYLSTVEDLDMMIYQSGVMASYRPDNRKKYPLRRVRDFGGLGAGARRLQNKFALTHVELFGYLENRISPDHTATSYRNIYPQILSAATVAGTDGIALFSYHAHVYEPRKRDARVERSRAAVADGLKAYALITSQISREHNPLAVYFPYSDWIIERWANYFLPALDAFRALGIPVDILPYAPPLAESFYPYYPFHSNKDVLARLLRERTILVLPNVSGFQQTDSDLIKAFVEQGGVVVAFGPQIPMGRSYERRELFGGEEVETKLRASLIVKPDADNRFPVGSHYALGALESASWKPTGASVLATFDDGSAAILAHRFGKGMTMTVLPDALTMAKHAPELARLVLDYALQANHLARVADFIGTNENVDVAVETTSTGFRMAVVNHDDKALEIEIKPLIGLAGRPFAWIDMLVPANKPGLEQILKLRVPSGEVRCLEFRLGGSK